VKRLGLGSRHVPYWMGQTWVAARATMVKVRSSVASALLSVQLMVNGCDLLTLAGA
jgi:hypothetical protein